MSPVVGLPMLVPMYGQPLGSIFTGSPVPYPDNQGTPDAQDPSNSGGRGNTVHLDRYSGHMSETAQGHRPGGSKG